MSQNVIVQYDVDLKSSSLATDFIQPLPLQLLVQTPISRLQGKILEKEHFL
jgi:hypothetical protein